MTQNQQPESRRALWLARLAALGVLLLAALVLVGWVLDSRLLKVALPGQVAMKANTAVAFALAALALWLLASHAATPWRQRVALGFALVVAALGAVSLIEYLLGTNLGLDQLLFREPADAIGTSDPGRMAPMTAVCFVLLGAALWWVTRPRLVLTAQALAVLGALIGLLNLIGYVYEAEELYKLGPYTPMALPTAAAFLALGVGVLWARPDLGLMRTIMSDTAGGVVARRLLPVAVLLPVALGWLRLQGQRAGLYDTAFGVALTAVAGSLVLLVLIWWTAQRLERADRKRQQAEQEYHAILQTAIDGFWVVDAGGRFLEVNAAYCRMSGYSYDELLLMRISDVEATETSDDTKRHIEKVIAQGSDRFETRHRRRDGSTMEVEVGVQYSSGRGGGFIVFVQDITQRKRAEESLRQLNERLEQRVRERTAELEVANLALREHQLGLERQGRLLEQSQAAAKVGGWELDLVTRQLYWTEGTYRIHELTPADYTPTLETAIRFYAPESRPIITAAVEAGMNEGKEWDLELELITATQRRIWVRAVGKVQFAEGRPVKAYGAFQDITGRKQVAERLRLQASALESAANAIIITDCQGIIRWINPAFTRLTGYAPEEAVGRNPRELIKSGQHDAAFFKHLWATILDGRMWQGEIINRRKDGTRFTEFQTITPVRNERGEIRHFIAIKEDITERKRVEEEIRALNANLERRVEERTAALRESEERFRQLAETMPDALLVGQNGKNVYANAAAARLLRAAAPEELAGLEIFDIIAPAGRARAGRDMQRLLAGEKLAAFEDCLVRRDGSFVPVEITASLFLWQGWPAFQVVARDITERKAAEAERANLVAMLEATPDFVGFADAQSAQILYINQAGRKMTGLAQGEDVTQLKIPDVHPEWTNQMFREVILPTAIREGVWTGECAFLNRDGREIPVTMVLLAHQSPSGEVERFSTISRDITERKKTEAAIQQLNAEVHQRAAQLEDANKELESFSYSVSHDLRAPLRHVQGYVEMLHRVTEGQLSDQARRYLKTITDASVEMGQLIDDLLAFSRMGRTEMHETSVRLDALVQDTVRGLEMATQGRNIVWKIAPLPPVLGDPSLLKQVLANLLGNAVKYTRPRDPAVIEIGVMECGSDGGMESAQDSAAPSQPSNPPTLQPSTGPSCSLCATTARVLICNMRTSSLAYSSDCIGPMSSKARASAWPPCGGSLPATAGAPGPRASSTKARHFISP